MDNQTVFCFRNTINIEPIEFFQNPQTIAQKQYEALRVFFVENKSASEVAHKFGYTCRCFTIIYDKFFEEFR